MATIYWLGAQVHGPNKQAPNQHQGHYSCYFKFLGGHLLSGAALLYMLVHKQERLLNKSGSTHRILRIQHENFDLVCLVEVYCIAVLWSIPVLFS